MITTKEVIDRLKTLRGNGVEPLPLATPEYSGLTTDHRPKVGLAVESMKRHTTDEGWQIFAGLESAGYVLTGHNLTHNYTDVYEVINRLNPGVVIVQDKREWDVKPRDFRDPRARFNHVGSLGRIDDIFKLTIVKDAQHSPAYHAESAVEIGAHAWVVYYHPDIVAYLAPYARRNHLIRTYHSVNPNHVPDFVPARDRSGILLSGAVSSAYPLRRRLIAEIAHLRDTTVLGHPGYRLGACYTPEYLKTMSQFKVAICTASVYGYALRKIIEATAAGCMVLTDLPVDDVLPEIDANLVRIHPDSDVNRVDSTAREMINTYDEERQRIFADRALAYYDYRSVGYRLAVDIERLRHQFILGKGYNAADPR